MHALGAGVAVTEIFALPAHQYQLDGTSGHRPSTPPCGHRTRSIKLTRPGLAGRQSLPFDADDVRLSARPLNRLWQHVAGRAPGTLLRICGISTRFGDGKAIKLIQTSWCWLVFVIRRHQQAGIGFHAARGTRFNSQLAGGVGTVPAITGTRPGNLIYTRANGFFMLAHGSRVGRLTGSYPQPRCRFGYHFQMKVDQSLKAPSQSRTPRGIHGFTSAYRLPASCKKLPPLETIDPQCVTFACCQAQGSREDFPLKTRLEPPFSTCIGTAITLAHSIEKLETPVPQAGRQLAALTVQKATHRISDLPHCQGANMPTANSQRDQFLVLTPWARRPPVW